MRAAGKAPSSNRGVLFYPEGFLGVEEEKTLLARVRAFVLGKEGPNLAVPAGNEKRSVCCSALCSSGVCPRLSLV